MNPVDSRKPVTDILVERRWQLRGTAGEFVHVSAGGSLPEQKRGAGGGSRTLTSLLSPADFHAVYGFRRPDAAFC
jgi:hypothetical protein